jgi:hypothetical protein
MTFYVYSNNPPNHDQADYRFQGTWTPPAHDAVDVYFANLFNNGTWKLVSSASILSGHFGQRWKLISPTSKMLGHDPDLGDWELFSAPSRLTGSMRALASTSNALVSPASVLSGRFGFRAKLVSAPSHLSGRGEWEGHWAARLLSAPSLLSGLALTGGKVSARLLQPASILAGRTGWRASLVSTASVLSGSSAWPTLLRGRLLSQASILSGSFHRDTLLAGVLVSAPSLFRQHIRARLVSQPSLLIGAISELLITETEAYVFTLGADGTVAAVTRYDNFPFTEVMRGFDGKILLFGPDGLYELTGDTDDGEQIDSSFRTGTLDLGQGNIVRLVEMWLRTRVSTGAVHVNVITDETMRDQYERAWRSGTLVQQVPIRFGHRRLSTSYVLEVSNVGGGSLGVEGLQITFDPATRKVR